MPQSTRNIFLVEPEVFGFNPHTASTNEYQRDAQENPDEVYRRALKEFRDFRDALVEAGVCAVTMRGPKGCPDAVFPNWFSTHQDGTMILYPMMTENRAAERTPEMIAFLRRFYNLKADMSSYEAEDVALESTASILLDRVNHVAYIGRSKRTDEDLAREWCNRMDYELIVFDSVGQTGKPIYHTDVMMWIGTEVAGLGLSNIVESDRKRVTDKLSKTHDIIEFSSAQIRDFCGNAIEVRGRDDLPVLVTSERAQASWEAEQIRKINRYYTKVVSTNLETLETYGGGSARCMVQELF